MDAPERMEDMRFPGEMPRVPNVATPGTAVPDRIRVARDSDGFWTCREAISGSQEYVRADLYARLSAENERLKSDNKRLREYKDYWFRQSLSLKARAALEKRDE